ncbi:hypothetical protein ANN_20948 [Periplaneta americana]|uniref:Uncharacterized protein n=1 Tax=Periplaneta americana TaxID=6978 RepID=A0ABQ8SE19_PERAM|nr:hypothetical protein ANN_20948 [Periplaneta americana]
MADLCEGGNEPPGSLKARKAASRWFKKLIKRECIDSERLRTMVTKAQEGINCNLSGRLEPQDKNKASLMKKLCQEIVE